MYTFYTRQEIIRKQQFWVSVFVVFFYILFILFLVLQTEKTENIQTEIFPEQSVGKFNVNPHVIEKNNSTVFIEWSTDEQMTNTEIHYTFDDRVTLRTSTAISLIENTDTYTYRAELPYSSVWGMAYQIVQSTASDTIISEMQTITPSL